MPTLPKFVVHLERLDDDIDKVSLLLNKFQSDMNIAGFTTPGFSFNIQANTMSEIPGELRALVEKRAEEQNGEDIFGNTYRGYAAYQFIEIAIDPTFNKFTAIRLLGDTDESIENQTRFAIFDTTNTFFTATTINTLSDIRELSDGITLFFGASGLSDVLRCGQDANNLENIANRAGSVVGLAQINLPGQGVQSDLTWNDYLNEYVLPKVKAQPTNSTDFTRDDLKLLVGKFDQKSFKTDAEKVAEEAEWASADFKARIASSRENAFEVVNASAEFLSNPEGLASKIQTLGDAYTQILDKVSLGCLIKSAMDCIIPPLTCKEILRGLRISNIEEKIELAFPNAPRLAALVQEAVVQVREENLNEAEATDRFLDLIEVFIDLEAICDAVSFASGGGFSIPTIELPEIDIIDLFGGVEIAIEDAILSALTTAILEMILGVLEDLVSCDNLDAFVAGALNGQVPTDTALGADLARLFTEPGGLIDPEKGAIASSLDERWDAFVVKADTLLEEAIKVEVEGGVDVLGGAVQLRAQLDAVGGLEGLREAIEGNLGELATRAVLESFFQGQIDFTQLLRFQGGESADTLNSLVAEIGRFEISDDGNSFTLRRISDDQAVVIFSAIGQAPQLELSVSGNDLANTIGLLLDDTAAVLSPGQLLNLLAGTPTKQTVEVIIELIKISYEQISFINKPDQVITLFKTLGDLTGTNNIRDGVVLASGARRNRSIPRKFCPEDDEGLMLQEEILVRSFPPEEVRTIIDDIIEKRRLRYNELADILVNINNDDFSPTEVLEPIICGLNPDGVRPAVVDDALGITINTIFEPTKMAFDREIPKYTDAISSEEKVIRMIPRTIRRSGDRPVFGTGDNLFGGFSDFLSSIGLSSPFNDEGETEEEIINPEWSRLISQGMVPPQDDGSTFSDALGPYTNGPPLPASDVVRRVGATFKKAFRFEDAVSLKQSEENKFEVQIKGSLPVQSPVQEFSPFPAIAPSWFISYKETNQTLSLSLSAQGSLFSPRIGRIQFSDNFYFGEDFSRDIAPDVQERVDELNEIVDGTNSKSDIYSILLSDNLRPGIEADDIDLFNVNAESYFKQRYEEFITSFLSNAGRRVANNRLLKKIPNRTLDHLGPGTSEFNSKEQTETLIISLINFSATPTDGQKRCRADPHLLDLEFIKTIVKEEYDKDCEIESNNDGTSRSRSPINASGFVGVVLTVIRLYVIEYVLRGLFVFDEYGYKTEFGDDQLLTSYISFRIKKDLERQGALDQGIKYYDAFEVELKEAYRKLVENSQFDIPEEPLPPPGTDGVPSELKVLVKEQLKAVLEKVAEIIGQNPDVAGTNLISDLLTNLPILDTFSDYQLDDEGNSDYTPLNRRLETLFQPESPDRIPFPPIPPEPVSLEDEEGKYIIERYLRVPESVDSTFADEQRAADMIGVVNFRNWEELLDNNPDFRNERLDELFEEPWKYGYRLVFVTPLAEESATKEQINDAGKKFKLLGPVRVKVKESQIKREKTYHILERDPQSPTLAESASDLAEGAAGNFDSFLSAFGLESNLAGAVDDLTEVFEEPPVYRQFNAVPIAQVEVPIDDFIKLKDAENEIEQVFEEKYASGLFEGLVANVDTRTLFDYCFFSKRLVTFMLIHSSMVINNEEMKLLFEGTKTELKKLFNVLRNMGDYTSTSEAQFLDGVPGNAGAYKADFDQIGSPSGPKGPDAFYLASITPILILRGLAELIDPNIAVTAKIVAAGNAGYLFPKYVRNEDGSIKLSGTEQNPGPPVIQFAPVGVINPNDGFECILRASDDLPSWADEGVYVEWKAPDVPTIPGLPPLEIPDPEEPLFIPRGPAGELFGLDRSANTETPDAIVQSLPEFPGESVNLPYNLVSLATLPLQIFFPYLGGFCGPPYNTSIPLGIDFLRLEPLIYQLPNYKFAFEETDVAEELLASENIDLSGRKKIKCPDDTEPDPEPTTAPLPPGAPPQSESC